MSFLDNEIATSGVVEKIDNKPLSQGDDGINVSAQPNRVNLQGERKRVLSKNERVSFHKIKNLAIPLTVAVGVLIGGIRLYQSINEQRISSMVPGDPSRRLEVNQPAKDTYLIDLIFKAIPVDFPIVNITNFSEASFIARKDWGVDELVNSTKEVREYYRSKGIEITSAEELYSLANSSDPNIGSEAKSNLLKLLANRNFALYMMGRNEEKYRNMFLQVSKKEYTAPRTLLEYKDGKVFKKGTSDQVEVVSWLLELKLPE